MKRFIADTMLGKLAKWLRVMGYDTYYQSVYRERAMEGFIQEGRVLLSRNRSLIEKYRPSFFIRSERINEQLIEMRDNGFLKDSKSLWFSRCLVCNEKLRLISINDAPEKIPDYVYYQNITIISYCTVCSRYYWPGSHRGRMLEQLSQWGVTSDNSTLTTPR